MSDFYPLKVSGIRRLTPESVAVSLTVPESQKEVFSFRAGQYITIRHNLPDGSDIRRAYSISSDPASPELTIGIKKVKDGQFSVYANEKLSIGDELEVMKPEGRFTYTPGESGTTLLAVAAGSGITPIMSIIRTALRSAENTRIVLVYGNRSREQTMFLEDIEALSIKYPNRFFVHFAYSRSHSDDALFGRIERSTVNFILKNKYADWSFERCYICGPEEMIETVEGTLRDAGVPQERIHHELFTEPEGEDTLEEELEGRTRVTVILDRDTREIVMDQKERILDAVLAAKIDAPYSCQGGICSTCIARVKSGSAQMAKNQILTNSEIEEGLILTCQAHPTSPTLTVDYDDV